MDWTVLQYEGKTPVRMRNMSWSVCMIGWLVIVCVHGWEPWLTLCGVGGNVWETTMEIPGRPPKAENNTQTLQLRSL